MLGVVCWPHKEGHVYYFEKIGGGMNFFLILRLQYLKVTPKVNKCWVYCVHCFVYVHVSYVCSPCYCEGSSPCSISPSMLAVSYLHFSLLCSEVGVVEQV